MGTSGKSQKKVSPPQLIIFIFLLLILIGTILLRFPVSSNSNTITWIDALFTATSAVCVNGLVVINTGSSFSTFGQVVIMILIQIGGLGFMTLGVMIAILLGRKIGLRQQLILQETTQASSRDGLTKLCLYIFMIAFIFELVATIILTLRWVGEMGLQKASYYALFHSVSAFNNAGFSLWPDSLSNYLDDPVVNLTIITLFIFGGLGYIVIVELFKKRDWKKFSLHTKVVLVTSGLLTICGFIVLLLLENWNPTTFANLTMGEKIAAAFFQSTTPRSAGFNTIDIGNMLSSSQLIIIILMFIGASSGGTGGGIKTNTFFVLILATLNTFRGGGPIHVFKRKIGTETVMRALAVVVSSLTCVFIVALLLTITENMLEEHFLEVLFEATSAFSTTGLSMGLTSELTSLGKIIVTITMFIGRLGPLTLAYALAKKKNSTKIGYPEDQVLIG
ncbi:Ktr system potassium transporter B [Alkalihalobacillus alcalophilus ATCC 27647 = CGMCC 1.3604]|uniref:Ktr system potassium transporter B n=1 Tax=Alkalihalobacillus alcalophilus ATCC 27647 = CGMCC 1.3604 TaxID=1218173 RepID=J8TQ05_ALKAL|nr:TrkH family potassium uptake protein [Alkalihalobacillus alcalophilus]AFV25868.1 potassium ion uptake transporter [Alkalihalobacillus alcalophilus ATCC 27647 = CGMCC 1.3604]KGA97123.1 Ktr system potassium transporter B [Alkalihalobacillus alcalophilus ATCC 27647 = CGMCC 1.3604]MED1560605.1 TrkH family potassium uptake protein [Alkalihalobacillus alcalophilus]THG89081.1 Ktr system potassium transporter B [Alkalihalobacillus alcalophilus ATCC 27647 = CGMCC 1.3604]